MTHIPDVLDVDPQIFDIDRPRPEPRPIRIPEATPTLQERPPVIVSPTAYEIIRRVYESLP